MSRTLLVTGGAGFIGSALVRRLPRRHQLRSGRQLHRGVSGTQRILPKSFKTIAYGSAPMSASRAVAPLPEGEPRS